MPSVAPVTHAHVPSSTSLVGGGATMLERPRTRPKASHRPTRTAYSTPQSNKIRVDRVGSATIVAVADSTSAVNIADIPKSAAALDLVGDPTAAL
jgi:hypothetical protein|eukprot:COSAG01_NODE_548_length_15614_cov_14.361199_10_plen_95_part_00